ncbi:hypothetical protein B5C34_04395 [Pacificimonas flava]|uniref:peptidylprolyl isomerase n=2 Tax=Pacificimonas TaxID=1960290 RepID=A0A219B3K4_9SPHN|nr:MULTISPECIES: peptidylprolyl isomerase [Pacificimonas]MBZ6377542.1 peptidylprolyl isomerase [Pacificimonas aurantium]OWV32764.1 hypothetical protein B5C34_04395 [Pacificimonas flava]
MRPILAFFFAPFFAPFFAAILFAPMLVAAPAAAQEAEEESAAEDAAADLPPECPPPPALGEEAGETAFATERVALETEAGTIVFEIESERAPVTAANFLRYIEAGRLENAAFYRASKKADGGAKGFVQFGLRQHPDYVFDPIAHEPTSETGLTHEDGAISMVRGAPGTADADFLIMVGDQPAWDARDDGTPGYAVFGRVVEGMETVKTIWNGAIDPDEGEGVLKGEILAEEVDVTGARVTDPSS